MNLTSISLSSSSVLHSRSPQTIINLPAYEAAWALNILPSYQSIRQVDARATGALLWPQRAGADYAAVATVLPEAWRQTHAAFRATIQAMAHEHDLPEAVIHGDAWAGNLVQSAPDKVTLIDWELAGLGLAILDLGRLLLFCHEDVDPPSTVWIEPEAWRVEAVVDGYCQQRIPLLRERDMLLEAVRYPIVIEAASEFPRARQHGWDEESQERLRIRRHWYDVSEEIARHGRERINQRRSS